MILKQQNPNYIVVSHNESNSGGDMTIPTVFRSKPPGPVVQPSLSSSSSSPPHTAAGTTASLKRKNMRVIDTGVSKKRKISTTAGDPKRTYTPPTKIHIRKMLMKQFLRELQLHLNKMREPWYEFASLYVAAMGGLVKIEDLILCYPYDVYTPTLWEKRYMMKSQQQQHTKDDASSTGPIDVDLEEKEDVTIQPTRGTTKVFRKDDFETDNKRRNAVNDLANHIKEMVGDNFKEHGKASSLDALLRASARFVLDQLFARKVKEENSTEREDVYKQVLKLDSQEEEEEKGKGKEKDKGTMLSSSTTPTSSTSLTRDISTKKTSDLTLRVKKEAEKMSKAMPGTIKGITLDFDLDDTILNPSYDGDGTNDIDTEYMDEIEKTMGMNVFNPGFKGLITLCTDDINGLSDGPFQNFTSFELCTSPIVRSQFAKFMALCSTPVNNKYSTKVPFTVQPYASNFGGNASGNTVIIQPSLSRYIMAANKTEIKAMYDFFSTVVRSYDGNLIIPSRHRNTTIRNTYGHSIALPDEHVERSEYDKYLGRYSNRGNFTNYSSDKSRFGPYRDVSIDFVL